MAAAPAPDRKRYGRLPAFADAAFDLVMEITAADNLIGQRARQRLWREMTRVIKPGGYLFSYHFNPADGYYGPRLQASPQAARGLLFDPQARMYFRFYQAADILAAAGKILKVVRLQTYHYPGPMFGRTYERNLTAALFQRSKGGCSC